MKNFKIFVILFLFLILILSCNKKHWVPINSSILNRHYTWLLNDSISSTPQNFALLSDTSTAIKIAETYLFKIFGENKIIKERPYEIGKINGCWYITGSLPKYSMSGGTFEILLEASTGKVIKIGHGK